MSNSAVVASPLPATRDAAHPTDELCANHGNRPFRNDRSAGKGRRRRAAAEQRRIEQQQWGRLMHDSEEEIFVAPRTVNRRHSRRSARHLARDELDDCLPFEDDNDLDVALALSLSLSENARNVNVHSQNVSVHSSADVGIFDMSYENLVLLENVKCAASSAIVSSLTGFIFDGSNQACSSDTVDELCAICQNEYKVGDSLMLLPCTHNFHDACGSEWLLNHSKLCPVCKHDITDKA